VIAGVAGGIAERFGLNSTLYRFSRAGPGTVVELHATIELDGVAAIAGPFAVRGVKRGMDANLAALKTILEGC
jgi:hypothetical protein